MSTIFLKIIAGEIPSHKVAENEHFLAFLDINPLAKGHTLVIPKKEIDYIFDMDDTWYSEFQLFAKQVAHAIKKVIPCEKIGVAVIGLEVAHAHIHLVPINSINDLDFGKPKLKLTPEELAGIAEAINKAFVNLSE
ncbi:MAG: HIT family protein [Bacteroidales bacterium]